MITAVMPPMKTEIGFLNTRHDTESGDMSAASPLGREKSMRDWSLDSSNTRVAASRLRCNGQGRTIGLVTANNRHSQN
jgi:hypothetical protein